MRPILLTNQDFHSWVLGGVSRDISSLGSYKLILINFQNPFSVLRIFFYLSVPRKVVFVNQDTFYRLKVFHFMVRRFHELVILYTHTDSKPSINFRTFSNIKVVCLNTSEKENLISFGFPKNFIQICPTGVDFDKFVPSLEKVKKNKVILVSNFKIRKNPLLTLKVICENSDFHFHLVGRGWEKSEIFAELNKLDNFSYSEFKFEEYISLINKNHIFLSLSTLEGGPLPMLEAMACNLIPVCVRTGWVSDILKEGKNGFILECDSTSEQIREALLKASAEDFDTRDSISQYSYERYLKAFLG